MAEQGIRSPVNDKQRTPTKIPVEIVSEEELAQIEAAYNAASPSSPSPSRFQLGPRSVRSITLLSKRRLFDSPEIGSVEDIEDSGRMRRTQKRNRVEESYLHRFRRKRGLAVSDITSAEWCEKQTEYSLLFGKQEISKSMKIGFARHVELHKKVARRVEVRVEPTEDVWAIKFLKFILGANQLIFDGLTRELPLIGFVEGVWMVGMLDEIRMPENETRPTLVDTKTRVKPTSPAEPQQRKGRLQLMCYKYLWDNMVADNFSSWQFFDYFSLNPDHILSEQIRESIAKSGFLAKTLDELVRYFKSTCRMLPPAHDQLLLRYEFQEDKSLLGEDQFEYEPQWVKAQIQNRLEFWQGEREAEYIPKEESWKCNFCEFATECPNNTSPPPPPPPQGTPTKP